MELRKRMVWRQSCETRECLVEEILLDDAQLHLVGSPSYIPFSHSFSTPNYSHLDGGGTEFRTIYNHHRQPHLTAVMKLTHPLGKAAVIE